MGPARMIVESLTPRPGIREQIGTTRKSRNVREFRDAADTGHSPAEKRHDISRNLIRIWVKKLEAGVFDEDGQAADLLPEYEAKIAALERMVGRQALEIEFLKGALKNARRSKSATTSAITGLMVSPLPKDAA